MGVGERTQLLNISLCDIWNSYQRVSTIATQNTINSRVHCGDQGFAGCHLLCDLWDGKHRQTFTEPVSQNFMPKDVPPGCIDKSIQRCASQECPRSHEAESWRALRSSTASTNPHIYRETLSPHELRFASLLPGIWRPILQNCLGNGDVPSLVLHCSVIWQRIRHQMKEAILQRWAKRWGDWGGVFSLMGRLPHIGPVSPYPNPLEAGMYKEILAI